MSYRTVTLANGDTVQITESVMRGSGPQGVPGPPGPPGTATTIVGHVPTWNDLPGTGSQGEAYVVDETGNLWSWNTLLDVPTWVDCGHIVGPAAVTSIGAQRSKTTAKSLTANTDWVVDYKVAPDWNDADPLGGKVLDEARLTPTDTTVDPDFNAYYIVTTTISVDTAAGNPTYTVFWKQTTGTLVEDSRNTIWTDGSKGRIIQHNAVLRTSSADIWQLHINSDVNANILGVATEWTRAGGGTGPEGAKGDPPTMTGGTTTTLAAGATATAAVVEDPPGSSNYRLDFGVPQGIPGEAQAGFSNFNVLSGVPDSEADPGGTKDSYTDQALATPDGAQRPSIPYFFKAFSDSLYRRLVSRLTTAQRTARGTVQAGEVAYDSDLKQYLAGQPGRTNATTAWYQIPTAQYGTSSSVYHGASTDRPNGSLYFKHD